MATPVISVASGGIAVTVTANGLPIEESSNGFGIAVTKVASGGLPVTYGTGGGSALPAGTFVINGIPMTIGGVPMQKAS